MVVGTECLPSAITCRFSLEIVVGVAEWICTHEPMLPPKEFVHAVFGLSSIADDAREASDPGSADDEVAVTTPLPGVAAAALAWRPSSSSRMVSLVVAEIR